MTNPTNQAGGVAEPAAVSVTEWIRNNYQDHPTIDSLCDALDDALRTPAQAPAAPSVGEPVAYQYRWFDSNAQTWQEWEPLKVSNPYMQTMEQRIAEVESYRYAGKQIYEVRALGVIATPPSAPAVTEGASDKRAEFEAVYLAIPGGGGLKEFCWRLWQAQAAPHPAVAVPGSLTELREAAEEVWPMLDQSDARTVRLYAALATTSTAAQPESGVKP